MSTKTIEGEIEESCCLKWSDHQNYFSTLIRQLLEEEYMIDVTLVASGERIQAHRIVLSACSTFFQEILSPSSEENSTIILSDISAQDVRSIVEFCYHGEVRIPVDNIHNLLEAAQLLKICGLMEIEGLDENDAAPSTNESREENASEQASEDSKESIRYDREAAERSRDDTDEEKCREKEKRRRVKRKKKPSHDYDEKSVLSAINDIKSGSSLVKTAAKYNIPRSSLYMRAKSLGIKVNSKMEYPVESVKAAIDSVVQGSSLQQAADRYFIPKTVLWRRMQKDGYQIWRPEATRSYGMENRKAAIKALQEGQNVTKVAKQYKIPKTTLFRDKARLVNQGKLPESFWKKRTTGNEEVTRLRLEEAVAACRAGKMSQAAAALAYRVPKTTIWRRLQREAKLTEHKTRGTKKSQLDTVTSSENDKTDQHTSGFAYCEVPSEIPYMDSNLITHSVMILTADEDGLNLEDDGAREIIDNQDSGQEDDGECVLGLPTSNTLETVTKYEEAES